MPLEIVLALAVNDVDGVMRIFDIFETPDNSVFILILERPVDSIDLFDFISQRKHLDEQTSRHFFKQAVEIVTRVFERGVFHNDIKDENFIIDKSSMRLKLIDFGAALKCDPRRVYTSAEFNGTRICPSSSPRTGFAHIARPCGRWAACSST